MRLFAWIVVHGIGLCIASVAHAKPTIELASAIASANVDEKAMETVVTKATSRLMPCYRKWLAWDGIGGGAVTIAYSVTAGGKPTNIIVQGADTRASKCIASVFGKLRFVKPNDKQPGDGQVELVFDPGVSLQAPALEGNFLGDSVGLPSSGLGASDDVSLIIRQPRVTGNVDAAYTAHVRAIVKWNGAKIESCYRAVRRDAAELIEIRATANFTIEPTGAVLDGRVTGVPAQLAECLQGAIGKMRFASPHGMVKISIPLVVQHAR